jgi:hypothetical protein
MTQGTDWRSLENSLKTGARFLNHLTSILNGIAELKTRDGRPLVVDAGPGADLHTLYRARVFQSEDELEAALVRPDIHLSSSPAHLVPAGGMTAREISAFYGANSQKAAIAEVCPPVGSQVVVAQFEIIRKLRLLDLTALRDVRLTESLADLGSDGRIEAAGFLRSLSGRIMRLVTRDEQPFEYLATQTVVDFLAAGALAPIDGIIFPSVQAAGDVRNVLLFHKAARVEAVNVPEGTEISVSMGRWTENGWVEDYEVLEKASPNQREDITNEQGSEWTGVATIVEALPLDRGNADWRADSLRIAPETVKVHRVQHVEILTDAFMVKRHRQEKRERALVGLRPRHSFEVDT